MTQLVPSFSSLSAAYYKAILRNYASNFPPLFTYFKKEVMLGKKLPLLNLFFCPERPQHSRVGVWSKYLWSLSPLQPLWGYLSGMNGRVVFFFQLALQDKTDWDELWSTVIVAYLSRTPTTIVEVA